MSEIKWPHNPHPRDIPVIAEDHARRWIIQSSRNDRLDQVEAWPIVTVAYAYGIPGIAFGRSLAKRLGFDSWDQGRVNEVARRINRDAPSAHRPDTRLRSAIDNFLLSAWPHSSEQSNTHAEHIRQVVESITRRGHAVIVGRGARLVVNPSPALHARLVAPVASRIQWVSTSNRISLEAAEKLVTAGDKKQATLLQGSSGHAIDDPTYCDLIVNIDSFDQQRATGLIQMAYLAKFGKLPAPAVLRHEPRLSPIVYLQPPIEAEQDGAN